MDLKILFVEDDEKLRNNLVDYFDGEEIGDYKLVATGAPSFEEAISKIKSEGYDIVVLDLFKGDPIEGNEKSGLEVLRSIQESAFIPVVFYSGLTKDVDDLASEIVGIVNKGEGLERLKAEIERIVSSNITVLKRIICEHIRASLREYFWDTIHDKRKMFPRGQTDVSLGYLLLRRIASSLSKEKIKSLLGVTTIGDEKVHPMEFYIYPPVSKEFEVGEVLKRADEYFIVLTPSCDFVERTKKDGNTFRKVGKVLLAKALPLSEFQEYINYKESQNKDNTKKLTAIISNASSDRYFFLPKTPFIDNYVIDFQNKIMVDYEGLAAFDRIARLDSPISESMISSFIRYYNRIGFPDLDVDFVLSNL